MRIGIVNYSRRREGGAEAYVADLVPHLAAAGHTVGLWSQCDLPVARARIELPADGVGWCAAEMGTEASLDALRAWRPHVIFAQGVLDPHIEETLPSIAPSVFVAHNYHATCVSGIKAFRVPDERPCHRAFGPACLALYLPRRCGGLDPRTMLTLYRRAATRADALTRYEAIVTLSRHMRNELLRNGYPESQVQHVSFLAPGPISPPDGDPFEPPDEWRLAFVGRLNRNKGGHVLLEALPAIRAALGRPVQVTFAGEGSEAGEWRASAARIARAHAGITVTFPGWLAGEALAGALSSAHLLVAPSVWPEPLGLVGVDAARYGVPGAAFDVGGVREWLHPGVSGVLAPADPPRPEGLAAAIVEALADGARYGRLRAGAAWIASRWDRGFHARGVLRILEHAARPGD